MVLAFDLPAQAVVVTLGIVVAVALAAALGPIASATRPSAESMCATIDA
jgi:hypothetical protein